MLDMGSMIVYKEQIFEITGISIANNPKGNWILSNGIEVEENMITPLRPSYKIKSRLQVALISGSVQPYFFGKPPFWVKRMLLTYFNHHINKIDNYFNNPENDGRLDLNNGYGTSIVITKI